MPRDSVSGLPVSPREKTRPLCGAFFCAADERQPCSPHGNWALTHREIPEGATALDVGCGGGRTIGKLAAQAAQVHGIDYAAGSVAASRSHNKRLIAEGRVHVEQASVSRLPFADSRFDLVTAVEAQYHWPSLAGDMKEILRVLKPGGRLMVAEERRRGWICAMGARPAAFPRT